MAEVRAYLPSVAVWAGALVMFTALAIMPAHQFWALEGLERRHELNAFLEHLAFIAAFVLNFRIGASVLVDKNAPPSGGYFERRSRRQSSEAGHGQATREVLL
jgi:hypothetical protein